MPIATGTAILGSAILSGVGGILGSKANSDAANTATQAQLQAAQARTDALREAQDKYLSFAREGQDYIKDARNQNAGGDVYLRNVIAGSNDLTPEQQTQLNEYRRVTNNTIDSSSLAGSGRTAAALFKKNESDFTNNALTNNRLRADSAAKTLSGENAGYVGKVGDISVGAGAEVAGLTKSIGDANGDAASNIGTINANATTANGALAGRTLGDIGGMINSENRLSRYAPLGNGTVTATGSAGAGATYP